MDENLRKRLINLEKELAFKAVSLGKGALDGAVTTPGERVLSAYICGLTWNVKELATILLKGKEE